MDDTIHSDRAQWRLGSQYGSPESQKARVFLVVAASLAAVVLVVGWLFVFSQSSWTYSTRTIDQPTADKLMAIHAELIALGAPEPAVRAVAAASLHGRFLGDAVEKLADADNALAQFPDDHPVATARQSIRAIYTELYRQQFLTYSMDSATPYAVTPLLPAE